MEQNLMLSIDKMSHVYAALYDQLQTTVGEVELEQLAEAALRMALRNLFLTFLTFVALALLAGWLFNRLTLWWAFWSVPGPFALPLIGNALQLRLDAVQFLRYTQKLATQYASEGSATGRIWLGTDPYLIVFKGDASEVLLKSSKHTEKSFEYDLMSDWLGRGLLTSFGKKWHKRRKLLTPAFHTKETLDAYLSVMNKRCKQMTNILQRRFATDSSSAASPQFDMMPVVTLCSLDIICDTAMAQPIEAQRNGDSNYVREITRASNMLFARMESPILRSHYGFELTGKARTFRDSLNYLHRFTERVIEERRRNRWKNTMGSTSSLHSSSASETESMSSSMEYSENFQKKLAAGPRNRKANFLDLLLQAQGSNPDVVSTMQDIREEVDTFMFEGHDTTSSAQAFAFWLLGRHPDAQRRLQQEIDTVLAGRPADSDVGQEDLRNMVYLDCVARETLRMFPSVPFLGRKLECSEVIDGHRIPAGTNVLIFVYFLQHDAEYFERPYDFIPERFLPGSPYYNEKRHPYAYIPFSAGPRNCIGQRFALMELKTMLVHVQRKFNVYSRQTLDELELGGALILRPRAGVWLTIQPRL